MRTEDLISPSYRDTLHRTHEGQKSWGSGGKYHWQAVADYATRLEAVSLLDYGCGQGVLKKRFEQYAFGYTVDEFDPGIPGKDTLPTSQYDLVVCTDVLEHVEPEYVLATLDHMHALARKGLFAIIALTPANLVLTDGRNAHLTIETAQWWITQISVAGFQVTYSSQTDVKGLLIKAIV